AGWRAGGARAACGRPAPARAPAPAAAADDAPPPGDDAANGGHVARRQLPGRAGIVGVEDAPVRGAEDHTAPLRGEAARVDVALEPLRQTPAPPLELVPAVEAAAATPCARR